MEQSTSGGEKETGTQQKIDVSKLVSIIPPASELKKKEKKLTEKRVRIRFDRTLNEPIAKIPSALASMLDIKNDERVEVVVAGRKRFEFKALVFESTDENVVYVYPGEIEKNGVADNSIATIRKVC
ncbi:hypothetical protein [Desulfurococcus amylolyticus]|uniref:hypothetical protein n=1 Tax=Desulfurococcus TaxID=2273 RepID=UPI0005B21A70|nr:hypothetical protein [Desulfurococcus amylolyticus]